ncbi:MAG: hypothetical protein JNK23_18660 [Opitutaceae bacterium]|nr:hypothetical protein [Opitutaceae bacterium]
MTTFAPLRSRIRCLRAAAVLLVGVCSLAGSVFAAAPSAVVLAVQPTPVADIIVLGGGFDAGLRQGMVCRITRGSQEIAEILLVDLRPACSTALIVSIAPRQSIRAGDLASTKLIKT